MRWSYQQQQQQQLQDDLRTWSKSPRADAQAVEAVQTMDAEALERELMLELEALTKQNHQLCAKLEMVQEQATTQAEGGVVSIERLCAVVSRRLLHEAVEGGAAATDDDEAAARSGGVEALSHARWEQELMVHVFFRCPISLPPPPPPPPPPHSVDACCCMVAGCRLPCRARSMAPAWAASLVW
eukprot:COSAG05_NODE_3352_length_2131_cov_1.350394_2_plen_184_part_00